MPGGKGLVLWSPLHAAPKHRAATMRSLQTRPTPQPWLQRSGSGDYRPHPVSGSWVCPQLGWSPRSSRFPLHSDHQEGLAEPEQWPPRGSPSRGPSSACQGPGPLCCPFSPHLLLSTLVLLVTRLHNPCSLMDSAWNPQVAPTGVPAALCRPSPAGAGARGRFWSAGKQGQLPGGARGPEALGFLRAPGASVP